MDQRDHSDILHRVPVQLWARVVCNYKSWMVTWYSTGHDRGLLRFRTLADETSLRSVMVFSSTSNVKCAYLDEVEALDTLQGEELPNVTTVSS